MSLFTIIVKNAINDVNLASNIHELEQIRINYLGNQGYLILQIKKLRYLPISKRAIIGSEINLAKKKIQDSIELRKKILKQQQISLKLINEKIDISLAGRHLANGGLHPITKTINRIEKFFTAIGFLSVSGQEIEDNYHNFEALNMNHYHPARNEHDTFWLDTECLLRTQTSNVQIRFMQKNSPPIKIIAPGRVYRKDYDQTHTPMFHQMEGLFVNRNVSFSNMKSILNNFICNFFEKIINIRFRPSYFPFTEPSAEVDILDESGKWLEVIGCGMVHPNVLSNVNINPKIYSGFAFGIGIERLTMIRYQIKDLRTFFENDLRFLKQFK